MDKNERFHPARLNILDPLGEIRRRARELYSESGSPADTDWTTFWEQAEEEVICSGFSRGSGRAKKIPKAQAVSPEIVTLIEQDESPLLSVLANAVQAKLTDHESLCLAWILKNHRLKLRSGNEYNLQRSADIAPLLIALAGEYDRSALAAIESAGTPAEHVREKYWCERLDQQARWWQPQTNHAITTVERLCAVLRAESRVEELIRQMPENQPSTCSEENGDD